VGVGVCLCSILLGIRGDGREEGREPRHFDLTGQERGRTADQHLAPPTQFDTDANSVNTPLLPLSQNREFQDLPDFRLI